MRSSVFTIASTLLLSIVSCPSHVQALKSRDNAVIPGYTDEGCYTEATSERALSAYNYNSNRMTVELCAAACVGYTYFGVEYGTQCYCGDSLNAGSVPAPPGDCNFPCPGNATEFCGAGNRLNVYSDAANAPPPPQMISTYNALGCYTETNGRALSDLSTAADSMTVEACGAFCVGYNYFGVEYGRECYCGYAIASGSNQVAAPECNMACEGSSTETCGGSLLLNMYQYGVVTSTSSTVSSTSSSSSIGAMSTSSNVPTTSTSSSSTADPPPTGSSSSSQIQLSTSSSAAPSSPTQSSSTRSSPTQTPTQSSAQASSTSSSATPMGPITVPSVGTCAWIGCYTEATYTRALNSLAIYDYDLMSPEICALGCAGYDMFGVEYGGECYCGNTLQSGSTLAPPSDCNMLCDGTPNQYCGAGNRLDVYSCGSPSSSITASGTPTSTSPYVPPILTSAPICNGDNCLNELRDPRFSSEASAFCSTYTTTINTNPAAIPTDFSNCDSSPSAVSSACTCLLWTPPATISSTSSTSSSAPVTSATSVTTGSASMSGIASSTSASATYSSISSPPGYYSSPSSSSTPGPSTSTSSTASPTFSGVYSALYVNVGSGPAPTPSTITYKRQTYNTPILLGGGSLSADCSGADQFYIQNGKLYDNGLLVATYPGAHNGLFSGSSDPGSVQGTFSIVNGALQWSNPDFSTTVASFCIYPGDLVIAVFDGKTPDGCVTAQIAAIPYTALCGGTTASTTFKNVPFPTASSISSSSVPTSTPLATCPAGADPETSTTVVPAVDPNVVPGNLLNLSPSNYATLYYAEPAPGTTVLEVEYAMTYPQVTLENSNLIDPVVCSGNTLAITALTLGSYSAISSWPQTGLVLITNSATCNSADQRGVYLVTSYSVDSTSLTVTYTVTSQTWTDVAETMEVFYGTGVVSGSSTTVSYTPSCTASLPTASSSSTSAATISYADLTPEEKAVVAFLTQNTTYDANGNVANTVPPASGVVVTPPAFDPTQNATQQAAAEDALQAAGLPSPSSLHNQTGTSLAGYCFNGAYIPPSTTYSKRDVFGAMPKAPSSLDPRRVYRRDGIDDESWWDYLFEFVCDINDAAGEASDFSGEEDNDPVGAIIDLICLMKEIFDDAEEAYENRGAIQCVLIYCWINVPPSEYWNFTYSWNANFDIPPQTLVESSVGTVSCVDCSLSVSEVQFEGSVMILMSSTPVLQAAYITPTVSWSANLVFGLEATAAWEGDWNYNYDPLYFPQPINVPGEFVITPSMTFGLGVSWKTDSAVSFTGGGSVSINSGSMYMDFMAQTATEVSGWTPTVDLTYPIFTSAATASFNPIMRSALSIQVTIMGNPYNAQPIYLTDATSIGFSAALIEADDGACPAGELQMTSFSSVANSVVFGAGAQPQPLYPAGDVAGTTKCFAVPNDIPTDDEIAELKSVGAAYCTSYLGYIPGTVAAYAVKTVTTPTTTQATTSTTISTKSTVVIDVTSTTVYYSTRVVQTPVYVYVSGSQSLASSEMKKRGLETPTATTMHTATRPHSIRVTRTPSPAARPVDKRLVTAPSFISTWGSSEISLACKQVATGTSTTTFYTSTKTVYSSTVTSTVTNTIDVLGAIVTSTNTGWVVSDGVTTVTATGTATTTITNCPLQTQVSCFTISGQGASNIGNQPLYYAPNDNLGMAFGGFGAGWILAVFYMTCEGYLVMLPSFNVIIQEQVEESTTVQWLSLGQAASHGIEQVCTQDTVAGTISCGEGWYTAPPPVTSNNEDFDGTAWIALWADGGSEFGGQLVPVALTYQEVACPCSY